jgi:hypothetical protein
MVEVRTSTVEVPHSAAAMPGRVARPRVSAADSGYEAASRAPDRSTITTLPPMRSAQWPARACRSRSARPAVMDSEA